MIERTVGPSRSRSALLAVAVAAAILGTGPVPGARAAAADMQITSPPGAQALRNVAYTLPVHPLPQGSSATYTNTDILLHDVVAKDKGADGLPLFRSKLVGVSGQSAVEGVEALAVGSYAFTCSLHGAMAGVLEVVDSPLPAEPPPSNPPPTEWPLFGRDLANSRHGDAGPATGELAAFQEVWQYAGAGGGDLVGSPILGGGRVIVGFSDGRVASLDRTTGEPGWERDLAAGGPVAVTASPAYHAGVVYVPAVVSAAGATASAQVIALRAGDGAELWRTTIDDEQSSGAVTASPVVWADTDALGAPRVRLFTGTSSADGGDLGTVVALDALQQGNVLWRTYMAEGGPHARADVPAGVAGAGVTSAPTVDTATGTVYVGTGGSETRHALTGSLVALSADDGQLLDHYQPTPAVPAPDAGFATSPQLIDGGRLGAGEQSLPTGSARYHVVDRATMEPVWVTVVGAGGISGATAYSGEQIYGTTVSGQLFALDAGDGSIAWLTTGAGTAGQVTHTQVANGVVYAVTAGGFVGAWDAATGQPAWTSPADPGALQEQVAVPGASEAGVAVVGDSLISGSGSGGVVRAYRAP